MDGESRGYPNSNEGGKFSSLRRAFWKGLKEFVPLLAFLGAMGVARSVLADQYHVPTGSMDPTVQPTDHVFVDKAAYGIRVPFTDVYFLRFQAPERGDVVVLDS